MVAQIELIVIDVGHLNHRIHLPSVVYLPSNPGEKPMNPVHKPEPI